jgi:two-component system, chemotaxis family, chemotaxis protein CheY
MEVFQKYNESLFMEYVPEIKKNTDEWWCMDVSLTGKTNHNSAYIALKLRQHFEGKSGVIFICNSKNILVLVRLGKDIETDPLIKSIKANLPNHSCDIRASDITPDGLNKIQLDLKIFERDAKFWPQASELHDKRSHRKERIVMVVDDDSFMRTLINKTFQDQCRIIEFKDAERVLEFYLKYLPDVVFLDIHLQGESGMVVLAEILRFDETAYVVILSSDSVKENILNSKDLGAKDFIAKPFTLEKLITSYNRCPTVTRKV